MPYEVFLWTFRTVSRGKNQIYVGIVNLLENDLLLVVWLSRY